MWWLFLNFQILYQISHLGKTSSVNNGRNCYLVPLYLSIPCHVCFQVWVWSACPAPVTSRGINVKEKVRPAWLRRPTSVLKPTWNLAQLNLSLECADPMITVKRKPTLLVKSPVDPLSVKSTAAQATTAMLGQRPASAVFSCCHAPWPLWWCFSKPETWLSSRLRSSTAHDQGLN